MGNPVLTDQLSKVFSIQDLKDLKKRFGKFLSKDDLRPVMNCIFWDATNRTLVATNAHILRHEKLSTDEAVGMGNRNFLLHRDVLDAMIKAKEPYKLIHKGNDVFMVNSDYMADQSKGICYKVTQNDRYPDWQLVIPSQSKQVIASCALTMDKNKIRGLNLLANSSTRQINLDQSDGKVVLSCEDLDFGTVGSYVPVCSDVVGDISLAFGGSLMLDILSSLDSDCLSFEFFGSSSAFEINGCILLMPVLRY